MVRGQYDHYRDEPGVARDSTTETYAALRLYIDSWRWADVPFLIRAGKAPPTTALEAVAELRPPPAPMFTHTGTPQPNLIRLRLGDDAGVTMTVQAKQPGPGIRTRPVDLRVDFSQTLGRGEQAHEKLLADAVNGDTHRFAREDMIEQAWRVVGPVLDKGPIHPYRPGTWGPAAADRLSDGIRWHDPAA